MILIFSQKLSKKNSIVKDKDNNILINEAEDKFIKYALTTDLDNNLNILSTITNNINNNNPVS